jgi:hypothetical protein
VSKEHDKRFDEHRRKLRLREHEVIVGLTSATARLIGCAVRDSDERALVSGASGLTQAILGLEAFRGAAGSDIGMEETFIAMQQMIQWIKSRNYKAASDALAKRLTPDGFIESMDEARKELGYRTPPS